MEWIRCNISLSLLLSTVMIVGQQCYCCNLWWSVHNIFRTTESMQCNIIMWHTFYCNTYETIYDPKYLIQNLPNLNLYKIWNTICKGSIRRIHANTHVHKNVFYLRKCHVVVIQNRHNYILSVLIKTNASEWEQHAFKIFSVSQKFIILNTRANTNCELAILAN